jgi:hypothetical protein
MPDTPGTFRSRTQDRRQRRAVATALHEYGLLRASFRPQAEIAGLRAYLRQRERLLNYASAHIQHMQKALMQMNLQLHHVVTDITGVTGVAIIRAIVAGGRDPRCWRRIVTGGVTRPSRRYVRRWLATIGRNTSSL